MFVGNDEEGLKLNSKFKELFDAIDEDSDGNLEIQELEEAVKDITIKKLTSKYIVKHPSEWKYEKDKWGSIEEILEKEEDKKHFENENKIIIKMPKLLEDNLYIELEDEKANKKIDSIILNVKYEGFFPNALDEYKQNINDKQKHQLQYEVEFVSMPKDILYTAITRAKKMCFIVGEEDAFKSACKRIETIKRESVINDLLSKKI